LGEEQIELQVVRILPEPHRNLPRRENHACLWSLIASCERHRVDPQRYLTSVLAKIGTTSAEKLEQFLPDVWKVEDAADLEA